MHQYENEVRKAACSQYLSVLCVNDGSPGQVTLVHGQMQIVWQASGHTTVLPLMQALTQQMELFQGELAAEQSSREQRDLDRVLRSQQVSFYCYLSVLPTSAYGGRNLR